MLCVYHSHFIIKNLFKRWCQQRQIPLDTLFANTFLHFCDEKINEEFKQTFSYAADYLFDPIFKLFRMRLINPAPLRNENLLRGDIFHYVEKNGAWEIVLGDKQSQQEEKRRWPDGQSIIRYGKLKFEGDMKNGLPQGNGKVYVENRLELEGQWSLDNRPAKLQFLYDRNTKCLILGSEEKHKLCGKILLLNAQGTVHVLTMKEGKKEGPSVSLQGERRLYEHWEDDKTTSESYYFHDDKSQYKLERKRQAIFQNSFIEKNILFLYCPPITAHRELLDETGAIQDLALFLNNTDTKRWHTKSIIDSRLEQKQCLDRITEFFNPPDFNISPHFILSLFGVCNAEGKWLLALNQTLDFNAIRHAWNTSSIMRRSASGGVPARLSIFFNGHLLEEKDNPADHRFKSYVFNFNEPPPNIGVFFYHKATTPEARKKENTSTEKKQEEQKISAPVSVSPSSLYNEDESCCVMPG